MKAVFGTDDPRTVALEIIKRGEIPLTTEQRKKLVEEKKAQIINLITKKRHRPQNKTTNTGKENRVSYGAG